MPPLPPPSPSKQRCRLCHRKYAPGDHDFASAASGAIRCHGFCLSLSRGLARRRDPTPKMVEAEVARCAAAECSFCGRPGAAAACREPKCRADFHLACFYKGHASDDGGRPACRQHIATASPKRTSASGSSPQKSPSRPVTRSTTPSPPKLSPADAEVRAALSPAVKKPPKLEASVALTSWQRRFCVRCEKSTMHQPTSPNDGAGTTTWSCPVCKMRETFQEQPPTNVEENKAPTPVKILPKMKRSFCGDLDHRRSPTHDVGGGRSARSTRGSHGTAASASSAGRSNDRSPLGPKQAESAAGSRATASTAPSEGKENTGGGEERKRLGKRKARDAWIVNKAVAVKAGGKVKQVKKVPVKKLQSNGVKERKQKKVGKAQKGAGAAPTAVSATANGGKKKPDSPAKKFVENSVSPKMDATAISNGSHNGVQPSQKVKKNLSKLFNNGDLNNQAVATKSSQQQQQQPGCDPSTLNRRLVKQLVQKVTVRPVADRLIFHVKTNLPIEPPCEEEAVEDYSWQQQLSDRQIDDFVDLNAGEKAFMKMWNRHLFEHECHGNNMLLRVLDLFIDRHAVDIVERNLYKNFLLHLANLVEFDVIDQVRS